MEDKNNIVLHVALVYPAVRATNLEWTALVEPATSLFKPAEEMRRLGEAKGLIPDNESVSYGQDGGRTAHGVLASGGAVKSEKDELRRQSV